MRLINADDMNEKRFYKEVGGKDSLITAEGAFSMIKAQPTAYDVNEVIKELDCYLLKIVGKNSTLYKTVVEIVKNGGMNYDKE